MKSSKSEEHLAGNCSSLMRLLLRPNVSGIVVLGIVSGRVTSCFDVTVSVLSSHLYLRRIFNALLTHTDVSIASPAMKNILRV